MSKSTVGSAVPATARQRAKRLLPLSLLLSVLLPAPKLPAAEAMAAPVGTHAPGQTGPTLRLDYAREKNAGNPVGAFMYFVPLISPEPVSSVTSPDSTLIARVISAQRHFNAAAFTVICDFEIAGLGWQQNLFDLTRLIGQQARKLKAGGVVRRQLSAIVVAGAGCGQVEIEGTVTNGVPSVTAVRLRFNAHGQTSPVSIDLCDLRYEDRQFRHCNEVVVRVNTLTFRRQPGPPKMEVTVASVKKKGAGANLWQSIKGGVKGVVANMLVDPLTVEATGHRAVLDFGQALAAGAPTFTFPRASNLTNTTALGTSSPPGP
jgi:hypothetical protein